MASGTTLREAAHRGDLVVVQNIIASGTSVNQVSNDRKATTALAAASNTGQLEVVKELLKLGANPNIVDAGSWTALHYACTRNSPQHAAVAQELLQAGADVSMKTRLGGSPLMLASREGCVATIQHLLQVCIECMYS